MKIKIDEEEYEEENDVMMNWLQRSMKKADRQEVNSSLTIPYLLCATRWLMSEKKAALILRKQQIKDNLEQNELNYRRQGEDLELQKKKAKENLIALDEQIKNYDDAVAAIKTISKEEKEKP